MLLIPIIYRYFYFLKSLDWNLILKNEISFLKIDYQLLFFNADTVVTLCHSLELDFTPKILESR